MRVLLVEDDHRIASFIAKGLRENAYAVDVADDGDEATYMVLVRKCLYMGLTALPIPLKTHGMLSEFVVLLYWDWTDYR